MYLYVPTQSSLNIKINNIYIYIYIYIYFIFGHVTISKLFVRYLIKKINKNIVNNLYKMSSYPGFFQKAFNMALNFFFDDFKSSVDEEDELKNGCARNYIYQSPDNGNVHIYNIHTYMKVDKIVKNMYHHLSMDYRRLPDGHKYKNYVSYIYDNKIAKTLNRYVDLTSCYSYVNVSYLKKMDGTHFTINDVPIFTVVKNSFSFQSNEPEIKFNSTLNPDDYPLKKEFIDLHECKSDISPMSIAIYGPNGYAHANSLIIQYMTSSDTVTITHYEPHGYKQDDTMGFFLKYVKYILEDIGFSNIVINGTEGVGIQSHLVGYDKGYCAFYSFFWLYMNVLILKIMRDNGYNDYSISQNHQNYEKTMIDTLRPDALYSIIVNFAYTLVSQHFNYIKNQETDYEDRCIIGELSLSEADSLRVRVYTQEQFFNTLSKHHNNTENINEIFSDMEKTQLDINNFIPYFKQEKGIKDKIVDKVVNNGPNIPHSYERVKESTPVHVTFIKS
jgi:hypothetical protein